MVELNAGDFTRSLGTGAGQVQFTANGGGFSAVGANRVVNLSSSAALTWGSGSFLPNGAPLMLGTCVGRFDGRFSKPDQSGQRDANCPGDRRLWRARRGRAAQRRAQRQRRADDYRATARLELTASNTYTGPTTVSGGILRLSNSAALPAAPGDYGQQSDARRRRGRTGGRRLHPQPGQRPGPGAVHGQRRRLRGRGGEPRREPGGNSATLTWGSTAVSCPTARR